MYTSAKRPGGQILGGTLCTTTPALVRQEYRPWNETGNAISIPTQTIQCNVSSSFRMNVTKFARALSIEETILSRDTKGMAVQCNFYPYLLIARARDL